MIPGFAGSANFWGNVIKNLGFMGMLLVVLLYKMLQLHLLQKVLVRFL